MNKIRKSLMKWFLNRYKQQKRDKADLGLANCLAAARATVSSTPYAFLITQGKEGWPSARLVEALCDPESFDVHIGTDVSLRKVEEIRACPRVTIAFGHMGERANLVIYGTARLITQAEEKRRYWKGAWRLFFEGGPLSEAYVVIAVEAERMEVMSFRRNVVAEPFGLRPMKLERHEGVWRIAQETRQEG